MVFIDWLWKVLTEEPEKEIPVAINLLKKYDDILLADHTLQYNGFEDMGKKLALKICRDCGMNFCCCYVSH